MYACVPSGRHLLCSSSLPLPFPPLPSPSYNLVFKSLLPIRRSQAHTEPYCTDSDIIPLPFSVFALDHLSGVQDRHSYDSLEGTHRKEEKEVKEVRDDREEVKDDKEEVRNDRDWWKTIG